MSRNLSYGGGNVAPSTIFIRASCAISTVLLAKDECVWISTRTSVGGRGVRIGTHRVCAAYVPTTG